MSVPPVADELSEADHLRIALIGAALTCVGSLGASDDEAEAADIALDTAAVSFVHALLREHRLTEEEEDRA